MMADLKIQGTEPVSREVLMMSVMKGSRCGDHRSRGKQAEVQVHRF